MATTKRRNLLLLALAWTTSASAWDNEELGPLPFPAPVLAVDIVPVDGGPPMVLALGAQLSWLIDPANPRDSQTLPIGGRDMAMVDVTGDGLADLLLCGPAGVQAIPWEGTHGGVPIRLTTHACEAIEVVDSPEGALVATAGDALVLWRIMGDGTLLQHERRVLDWEGRVLLEAAGELLAVSAVGADTILEWSVHGESTLAAGGPIGGLSLGPWGWAWSLPERGLLADMTHRTLPVGRGPTKVASGDLDQDGIRDLVVLHPETGEITLVFGSSDALDSVRYVEQVGSVGLGDVNGDGCDDLIVGLSNPPGLSVLRASTCTSDPPPLAAPLALGLPAEDPSPLTDGQADARNREVMGPRLSAAYRPPAPREKDPEILGVRIPRFLGRGASRPSERMPLQQYVVVGSGFAMGGALRNVYLQIPFFPALSVEMELGGPHFRWFLGGDSAALFLWMTDDGGGIHLANASTGFAFGSPRLRTGPFVTGGLLNFGAGWRTVFTPWEDGETFKGLEFRLTWFYPATGEVMLLYVWSQPMKRPERTVTNRNGGTRYLPAGSYEQSGPLVAGAGGPNAADAADAAEPTPEEPGPRDHHVPIRNSEREAKDKGPTRNLLACRRFGISFGAAIGASSTRYSWEYVGRDVNLSMSGSPAIALQCETGTRGFGLMFGLETAPIYSYLTKEDERLHHMGSHTFGVMLGGDVFRMGPTVTAGVWTLGGGLRTAVRIKEDRQHLQHYLDLRATVHYPSAPAGQILLLYGISWDPWGK